MKRIAWATDVHLNFVKGDGVERFCRMLVADDPDCVLIAGDIAEAPTVVSMLAALEAALRRPVYVVLGNHDFYRGSVKSVRAEVSSFCRASKHVKWMNEADVVSLTETTALVGHDGWGDARLGNGVKSPVVLNDFILIKDLAGLWPADKGKKLAALGDEAGAHFAKVVPKALETHDHVVVVTHVPPFRGACWHEGKISDDDWLPYFTCKAAGDALEAAMRARPDRRMTVLCGHTHSPGVAQILPNLKVITGGAEYGRPAPQKAIEVA
jgi:predicted MPP superfamily phosphohydrolase